MSSLRDLKTRQRSLQSTRKITSTMKMIASSKLHRYQPTLTHTNAYIAGVEKLLQHLLQRSNELPEEYVPLFMPANEEFFTPQEIVIIAITADRGMCGGFNTQIMQQVIKLIEQHKGQQATVKVLPLGRYAREKCVSHNLVIVENIPEYKAFTYEELYTLSQTIYHHVRDTPGVAYQAVYTQFSSTMHQDVRTQWVVPLSPGQIEEEEMAPQEKATIPYEFEPAPAVLLDQLLPTIIRARLYYYLAHSNASEHAARMRAMDAATRNADDLLKSIKLEYNRTRQNQITREMIEIISGAESL